MHAFTLYCSYDIEHLPFIGSFYACQATASTLATINNRNVTGLSGTSKAGKMPSDVQSLIIRDRTCQYFPRQLEKFMPNLEMVVIERSGLKEIQSNDLKPLKKLRFLYLSSNNLEILEDHLFEENSRLEIVNIDSNSIHAIGFSILKPLTSLKEISFLNNRCINESASNSTAIAKLKKSIVVKCSPSYVHILMDKISSLEKKIDDQNHEQKSEKIRISSLKTKIENVNDEATATEKKLGKRIHELKSMFDQLIANLTKTAYTTAL